MSELFAPVVSVTATQRRRFFWAAWWTHAPSREPFSKPDASSGGARTRDEALRAAELAAGRPLAEIEPRWARAWARVIAGQPPWTARDEGRGVVARAERGPPSVWSVLGLEPKATMAEIKQAYRLRALATHPDRGGDPQAFRELQQAYEKAAARRDKADKRPRKKR